ncbi:hypothetical protein DCCM_0653 [Desulfocucumis palustris]|uniref:Uncharacterized protein n=1 Tax=Desulfocucumis palustris TaxID=1898651 RepID=A0A2L2X8B6_9FIRM|nr:hypothetical protein DCCM_0653 [Desulfocucumis palustris]
MYEKNKVDVINWNSMKFYAMRFFSGINFHPLNNTDNRQV